MTSPAELADEGDWFYTAAGPRWDNWIEEYWPEIAAALRQADEAFKRGCLHQKHQDDVYVMELEAELAAIRERLAAEAKVRELLREEVRHHASCPVYGFEGVCRCGYEAAIAAYDDLAASAPPAADKDPQAKERE